MAATGRPRLQFEGAGQRCVLRQVWEGAGSIAYAIPGPSFGRDEAVHTTEIVLTRAKAE